MNDTRREWTRYHCNVVKEKHYIVLSLTGFFGFLTIIYYCAMRKHQKYKSKVLTRTYTFSMGRGAVVSGGQGG